MSRLVQRESGLPAELSSLVGRAAEIAAVRERLRMARVVTLTGPGGCGKTRLALRVAALAEPGFQDGARLVELASLTDPALVPASVAEALGVPERDAADPVAAIVRALAGRELLIVLDNCEHVLESAGRMVVMLAGQCPRVRILATGRERLDVPGESVFPVPPLGLPEDGSAGAVAASEAGTLFVTRARAASPGFALVAGNSVAVAEVCARLDDMPLAIELAAARCPALGPAQLAARLEGHPGLLYGGAVRPGRHRSLEALVAWSYDLLGEAERRLLARLSVLRGGLDLEVAERVAGGEPLAPQAIAGLLASLAGKSLVQVQAGPVVRYSLLEAVRQFAASRLAASGEETAVHAHWSCRNSTGSPARCPTPAPSATTSPPAASSSPSVGSSTTPPTRWARCSSTSSPPSPSSKSTCCACAPGKAWPWPGRRADSAGDNPNSRPGSKPSSGACTPPAAIPSPTSPSCSPCPGRPCTAPSNVRPVPLPHAQPATFPKYYGA